MSYKLFLKITLECCLNSGNFILFLIAMHMFIYRYPFIVVLRKSYLLQYVYIFFFIIIRIQIPVAMRMCDTQMIHQMCLSGPLRCNALSAVYTL